MAIKQEQFTELLLQALEHERGGVQVYEAALRCAVNDDLIEEWQEYHDQTLTHVKLLEGVCKELAIDPEQPSLGREIIQSLGAALVGAMEKALGGGNRDAAQLAACECVVLAETKDHLDWELLEKCSEHLTGAEKKSLTAAVDEVEDEEDEHLYHSKGWCRELWIESLGMKAILPPPEEEKEVKTAIGAARAEQEADKERGRKGAKKY